MTDLEAVARDYCAVVLAHLEAVERRNAVVARRPKDLEALFAAQDQVDALQRRAIELLRGLTGLCGLE